MGSRSPAKPTPSQGKENDQPHPLNTLGPVGIDVAAIDALNAALGGVTLLSQVVTYIQGAVVDVGVARFHGIEDIASYTVAKKEEIDAQTTLAKTSIDEHAVSAIQTAIQNNMQSIVNGVLEWLKRQGW